MTDAQRASIVRAPKMKYLTLDGQRLTPAALDNLKVKAADFLNQMTTFAVVRFGDARVHKLGLIQRNRLERLEIRNCDIDRMAFVGCDDLRRFTIYGGNIRELKVDSCHSFHNIFVARANIDHLTLSRLTGLGTMTLQGESMNLGTLRVSDVPQLSSPPFWQANITTKHLQVLQELPAIRYLEISSTGLGDDAAAVVAEFSALKSHSASSGFARDGTRNVSTIKTLKNILLYRNNESNWNREDVREWFPNVHEFSSF